MQIGNSQFGKFNIMNWKIYTRNNGILEQTDVAKVVEAYKQWHLFAHSVPAFFCYSRINLYSSLFTVLSIICTSSIVKS